MLSSPIAAPHRNLLEDPAFPTDRERLPASFRDRSGFVFRNPEGGVLRQVNRAYEPDYKRLMESGLYDELVCRGLLIDHEEVSLSLRLTEEASAVLRPRTVPFISYPYEWSFSALKAAALLTLEIQLRAMDRGQSLKDASAFNVQFLGNRPVFIDSLSFEEIRKGTPWSAYGQFCRHFLAPLALMSRRDIRLQNLLQTHLDGIPLDLAQRLLPMRTWLSPGLAMHLHLHARAVAMNSSTRRSSSSRAAAPRPISSAGLRGILSSLQNTISSLKWKPANSAWLDYYSSHTYTSESERAKQSFIEQALDAVRPETVWDLGANTGLYSKQAASRGATTIAFDYDPACIDRLYNDPAPEAGKILPLVMNLENPSSAVGWANEERKSLVERGPADLTLALALIHHLAIGNNVPLEDLAKFFHRVGRHLVIEYVPPTDPQVLRLLRTRRELPHPYNQQVFEAAFLTCFDSLATHEITSGDASGRVLYLLRGKR